MSRVSADLSNVEKPAPLPKNNYKAHIDSYEVTKSKAGNPNIPLVWIIDEGEYTNRKIKDWNIVISGTDTFGNPINTSRLGQLLGAIKIPWNCLSCNTGDRIAELEFSDGSNGKQKNKYYCPDCGAPMKVDFDTDHLQGARAILSVTIDPPDDKGNEWNKIIGYAPLGALD